MNKGKASPKLTVGILLFLFFGISLSIRVIFPFDYVFGGEVTKFTSIDAYYHMRLVDNLAHNFPSLTGFDPYYIYPGGITTGGIHFFDWLIACVIWIIGLGSPTLNLVDTVGVYFPAVLAALTVIPVFFIGRALFNKWVGVMAAGLTAIFPGEYLGRSILGFTDNHVAETLFISVTFMFLIMAIKCGSERKLTFNHLIKRDRTVIIRPLVYSLLAGIFLGIFLNTWSGALLAAFIISLYFIIQFIISHFRRQSTDHLTITGVIMFLVAVIMFIPVDAEQFILTSLCIGLLIPVVLSGVSRLMATRNLKPIYYPVALIVLALAGLGLFYLISPGLLNAILSKLSIFAPSGASAATTLEMQPFLSPQGRFSTGVAWGNYTTSIIIAPCVILFLLFYRAIYRRDTSDEENLFLLWTIIVLVLTLVQRRFAYYLVVNIALLSAYFSWQVMWLVGLRKLVKKTEPATEVAQEASAKTAKQAKQPKKHLISIYHINTVLAVIVVFFFVFFPNITKAKDVAMQPQYAPTDAWQESLIWMKNNTPEPFADQPDAYYRLYEPPPPEEGFLYPESAYGVTSWWDYGYWITRTAHRIPNTNPSQAAKPIVKVANFFLAENESSSEEIRAELGSSYVVIDYDIATMRLVYHTSGQVSILGKLAAIFTWAERQHADYFDIYLVPYGENMLLPKMYYYPKYYNSMIVRLYNFNGEAVIDGSPIVIQYDERVDKDGNHYKVVTDAPEFSSYQEALEYIESQETGNYRIVGSNPFISPIPLEGLEHYRRVYSSNQIVEYNDLLIGEEINVATSMVPEVKIFEYLD